MKLVSALCVVVLCALAFTVATADRFNEYKVLDGHDKPNMFSVPQPHTYVNKEDMPKSFNWGNIDGKSYLTKNLNQHIPQYCGSCWAHGALSALGDRIKIARDGKGIDINLAVQYILNCGTQVAGSCHGGSATAVYQFIKQSGYVPYDTCLPYEACSAESTEGHCPAGNYECKPINICRTCSTFVSNGGFCDEINHFPNTTIAEYGEVKGEARMMAEIYKRGPIACGVDARALDKYESGIIDDKTHQYDEMNHIISIVGWGHDEKQDLPYWIVRNSWGEYWGEMGYFRVKRGESQLVIEDLCSWATPGTWSENSPFHCWEDGTNCDSQADKENGRMKRHGASASYVDPFFTQEA